MVLVAQTAAMVGTGSGVPLTWYLVPTGTSEPGQCVRRTVFVYFRRSPSRGHASGLKTDLEDGKEAAMEALQGAWTHDWKPSPPTATPIVAPTTPTPPSPPPPPPLPASSAPPAPSSQCRSPPSSQLPLPPPARRRRMTSRSTLHCRRRATLTWMCLPGGRRANTTRRRTRRAAARKGLPHLAKSVRQFCRVLLPRGDTRVRAR